MVGWHYQHNGQKFEKTPGVGFGQGGLECCSLRESFLRTVDKNSRGPQGERGLEFLRRKKGQTFFFLSSAFLMVI